MVYSDTNNKSVQKTKNCVNFKSMKGARQRLRVYQGQKDSDGVKMDFYVCSCSVCKGFVCSENVVCVEHTMTYFYKT